MAVFPFQPNYAGGITERVSYRTDIITAWDGTEQRVMSRKYPRRVTRLPLLLNSAGESPAYFHTLWLNAASSWQVPHWPDVVLLTAQACAGATQISCVPAGREFKSGESLILWASWESYEVCTAGTVDTDHIHTSSLAGTWPAGTAVVPLRDAVMTSAPGGSSLTTTGVEQEIEFETLGWTLDPWPWSGDTVMGFNVLTVHPNRRDGTPVTLDRYVLTVDQQTGDRALLDKAGMPDPVTEFSFLARDRDDTEDLLGWIADCCGRCVPFWMPTWTADLVLEDAIDAADETLTIRECGYEALVTAGLRKTVDIIVPGDHLYFDVLDCESNGDGTETVTLDEAVGVDLPASTLVSFLDFSRLDTDEVELTWWSQSVVEVTLPVRAIPQETPVLS